MFIQRYRLFIVIAFLGIFSAKMMISCAPVFFVKIDKNVMKLVIMQLEVEHESDGDLGKVAVKYIDYNFNFDLLYVPIVYHFNIKNAFIDHFKRYVNPYHPSVPTPPPNSLA